MTITNTHQKKDLSVPMGHVWLYSLIFPLPVALVLSLSYISIWGFEHFMNTITLLYTKPLATCAIFSMGVMAHELIHGLSFAYFGSKPLQAIKFGFQAHTLTPYAHCKAPLDVNAYRKGILMPALVLGLLPASMGILTGNAWLMFFGLLFTTSAGGDLLILWVLRHINAGKLIEDHPTRVGCYVIEDGSLN